MQEHAYTRSQDSSVVESCSLVVNSLANVTLEQLLNLCKAVAGAECKLQLDTGILAANETRTDAVK